MKNDMTLRKLTVREAEAIARKVAVDRVRKKERMFDPGLIKHETEPETTSGNDGVTGCNF